MTKARAPYLTRLIAGLSLLVGCAAVARGQHRVYVEYEAGFAQQRLSIPGSAAPTLRARVGGREVAVYSSSSLSAEQWRRVPGVRAAYRDVPVHPRGTGRGAARRPDDPGFAAQWNMQVIDAPGAWDLTTGGTSATGQEIVIAVVESNGFAFDHPELSGQYYVNAGEVPGNGVDDDGNGYVDDVTGWNFVDDSPAFEPDNHGAHVAATLAARTDNGAQTAGLNWEASLLPFQVSTIGEWTIALDYIADLRERYNATGGADGAYVVVANMSLGADGVACGEWPPFNEAVDRLGAAGVLSVAAAGNGAGDANASPDFPTSCESEFLVMVTASDEADGIYRNSGFGARQVDLAAPGAPYRSIDYLIAGRVDDTFSGTSGAAPHAAGVAALAYALPDARLDALVRADPEAATLLVRDGLIRGVDLVDALDGVVLSGGRLNARGTLDYVREVLAVDGSLVVFLAEGTAPPELLPTTKAADTVEFVRTLGPALGAHLYARRAPLTGPIAGAEPGEVTATGPILAVARNVSVRLAAEPSLRMPAEVDGLVGRLRLPSVVEQASDAASTPVVALFADGFGLGDGGSGYGRLGDRGFARAPGEVAANSIDDDANGFVDDVSGRALDASSGFAAPATGGRGGQLAYAIAADDDGAIAGGSILPLTGGSLADVVAGADYALAFRRRFNDGEPGGQRVVAYAVPADASALFDGAQALDYVAERLLDDGVILIAPGLLLGGPEDETSLAGRTARVRTAPIGLAPAVAAVPEYGDSALEGQGAAVALVTAAVQRLYARVCPQRLSPPRAGALAVVEALDAAEWRAAGVPPEEGPAGLDATAALLQLDAACPGSDGVEALATTFPNPLPSGADLRVEVRRLSPGPASLTVFDLAGRQVYTVAFTADGRLDLLDVPTAGWPAGAYVVRVLGSDGEGAVAKVIGEGYRAP